MQKSYVAKTTINFVDFEFYVRPGDILVHDTHNQNRLTVYRNGQIVKVVKQDPLGIVAFLKNRFIEEISNTPVPEVPKIVVTEQPLVISVNPEGVERLSVSREPVTTPEASEASQGKQDAKKGHSKRDKQQKLETVEEYPTEAEEITN